MPLLVGSHPPHRPTIFFGWWVVLAGFVLALVVINVAIMATALYTWFERRMLGRFQSRLGPNRWGPFGLLQPIALARMNAERDVGLFQGCRQSRFSIFQLWIATPSISSARRNTAV